MKKRIALSLCAALLLLATGCFQGSPSPKRSPAIVLPTPGDAGELQTDAVSSASVKEGNDPAALLHAMTAEGYWIFSLLSDVTLTEELVVEGDFHDKDDPAQALFRKLSLYAQDANRTVTEEFVLTVPKITVRSPNFRIQCGTVKGDIYVEAEGFELYDTTVEGDLIFASEALRDAALLEQGRVTGEIGP